jgi:hypothetical protein
MVSIPRYGHVHGHVHGHVQCRVHVLVIALPSLIPVQLTPAPGTHANPPDHAAR